MRATTCLRPFDNLVVLDLTRVLAGPYAAMMLAGMLALNAITELLGARTIMSAPTLRARRA